MLLVVFGGAAVYKLMPGEDRPARKFTDLELAAADAAHTGTCYSLGTVLIANGAGANSVATWSQPNEDDDDRWTLLLENVHHGPNGPQHVFQKFTFQRVGEQVRLVDVDATERISTDLAANIDGLLEGPHDMRSTPVDRCQASGATGYKFTARN